MNLDNLKLFMNLYMYELELWLNEHSDDVLDISFQSDEANTDRPLKKFLQQIIKNECNCISKLKCVKYIDLYDYDGQQYRYKITSNITNAMVKRVYLPDEIPDVLKRQLKLRKNAVFTNPDLCIAIDIDGKTEYETIELKSTKKDAIPGSSIQQVSPDEWVIFVKHEGNFAEITVGQYFHAINAKMQFPDRSPRPQVSFSELQNWNYSCRQYVGSVISYHLPNDELVKYELLTDWKNVLAKRWAEIVLDDNPKRNEPWFNNNLRKFILEFLNVYDEMSLDDKEDYKKFLENIIE